MMSVPVIKSVPKYMNIIYQMSLQKGVQLPKRNAEYQW